MAQRPRRLYDDLTEALFQLGEHPEGRYITAAGISHRCLALLMHKPGGRYITAGGVSPNLLQPVVTGVDFEIGEQPGGRYIIAGGVSHRTLALLMFKPGGRHIDGVIPRCILGHTQPHDRRASSSTLPERFSCDGAPSVRRYMPPLHPLWNDLR